MMPLAQQVSSLDLSKQLKELGIKQDSLYSYFQYDEWNIVLRETKEIFAPDNECGCNKDNLICSAPTVAELGQKLPSFIKQKGKKYYLLITRTNKTEYSNLPDFYVGYRNVQGTLFLHSERDDNEANSRAKMVIYQRANGWGG